MGPKNPEESATHDTLQVPQVRRLRSSKSLQRIASTYKKVRDSSPVQLSAGIKHRVSVIKSTLSAKSSSTSLRTADTKAIRSPSAHDVDSVASEITEKTERPVSELQPPPDATPATSTRGPSWFALPAEIREQIYIYAFSGNTIHIHREWLIDNEPSELVDMAIVEDDNGQPYSVGYTICRAAQTDSEAYAKTQLPDETEHDVSVAHWQDRHIECRRANHHRQTELPVTLLRTCRQIYLEAAHILYCETTFCFTSSTDMDFFVRRVLPLSMKKEVRTFRTHAEHVFCSSPLEGLQQTTVDMLTGLRFLGLTVGYYKMTGHLPSLPVFTDTLEQVEIIIGPKKQYTTTNTAFRNRELAQEMEHHLIRTKRTEPLQHIDTGDKRAETIRPAPRGPIGSGVLFSTVAFIRKNEGNGYNRPADGPIPTA